MFALASLIMPGLVLLDLCLYTRSLFPLECACAISALTFAFFWYDKRQARSNGWRVSEQTLHTLAFFGGWPGVLLGMHVLQHKTRKVRFIALLWAIILLWQAFFGTVLYKGIKAKLRA